MNNRLILLLVVILIIGGGLYAGLNLFGKPIIPPNNTATSTPVSAPVVTNFEECALHYPVMESYPPQCNTPDGRHFVQDVGNALDLNDKIVNSFPVPDSIIKSPLSVEGEARGIWFFEASFPVRLEDASGKLIAQVPAEALSNWMTQEFVPYKAILTFTAPSSATGTLVLTRDDPSGLRVPEELKIPVRFR